jgi:hypothetical protein
MVTRMVRTSASHRIHVKSNARLFVKSYTQLNKQLIVECALCWRSFILITYRAVSSCWVEFRYTQNSIDSLTHHKSATRKNGELQQSFYTPYARYGNPYNLIHDQVNL